MCLCVFVCVCVSVCVLKISVNYLNCNTTIFFLFFNENIF